MARARSIKPGFFKNEALAELPFEARLLFAGLWTLADRDGRLEDRPKRIKAELFPYDELGVDRLLSDLAQAGFIVRYTLDGNQFIGIPTFKKHQNPHVKEAASTIPAPVEHQAGTVRAPGENSAGPGNSGTSPADSLLPEPSSLNPEPHSRSTESSAAEIAAACDLAGKTFDLTDEERAEGLNGNHVGNGASRKSLLNAEIESALALAAGRIHAKHPPIRRCGLGEVKTQLRAILRRAPPGKRLEVLRLVERNHAGWCATPDWLKENGQYAKGLENWLAPTKGRWEESPPVPTQRDADDGYRPVSEWDRAS
jgi:hypothetical protein